MEAGNFSKLDGSSSSNQSTKLEKSDGSRCGVNEASVRPEPKTHPSGDVIPPVYPNRGSDILPGPGAGMYPTRGSFGGDGSMLVGPNDPRWFGGDPSFTSGLSGVPPGYRFDPYGPPGVPGFERNRFARNPRRPGGGTHPDLEHYRDGSDFV